MAEAYSSDKLPDELIKGKVILIVDDEPDLRELLRFEFELYDCICLEAGNGISAFEIIKSGNPSVDIVISDVRMPKGDGVGLLENIRKMSTDKPAVFFVTGFADISKEEAYAMGVNGMFGKPYNIDFIVNEVKKSQLPGEKKWRKSERFGVSLVGEFQSGDNEKIQVNVLNIGQGGMFLYMHQNFPKVGDVIGFNLLVDKEYNKYLKGKGIVRWVRDLKENDLEPGIGIEFSELSDDSLNLVNETLKKTKVKSFIPMK
ncbi:MAG: response regulator [Bacteriovoracaceae bacterium]